MPSILSASQSRQGLYRAFSESQIKVSSTIERRRHSFNVDAVERSSTEKDSRRLVTQDTDPFFGCWRASAALDVQTIDTDALLHDGIFLCPGCFLVTTGTMSPSQWPALRRLGITNFMYCGFLNSELKSPSWTSYPDTTQKSFLLGGDFADNIAGRVNVADVPRFVEWINEHVQRAIEYLRRCILEGHVVLLSGDGFLCQTVVALCFLVDTYRISLLDAILHIRRRGGKSLRFQEAIIVGISAWSDACIISPKGHISLLRNSTQVQCICGRFVCTIIENQEGQANPIQHCSCEVSWSAVCE